MNDVPKPPGPGPLLPLIGVSACRRTFNAFPGHWVGERYLRAVAEAAGGLPLIVPALGQSAFDQRALDAVLDGLDGLLLTGSPSNIEPGRYGSEASRTPDLHDPDRDATTLPLIVRAIARAVPVLAICRGIQELNVALGGTLHQLVHDVPGRRDHRSDKSRPWPERYGEAHDVTVTPGSATACALGMAGTLAVNSLHAQAIDRPAPGLVVDAVAEDGTIEAVSLPGAAAFTVGVQWHAEWNCTEHPASAALFRNFGEAARKRAQSRAGRAAITAS